MGFRSSCALFIGSAGSTERTACSIRPPMLVTLLPQRAPRDDVQQSSRAASRRRTACGGLAPITPGCVSKHPVLRQTPPRRVRFPPAHARTSRHMMFWTVAAAQRSGVCRSTRVMRRGEETRLSRIRTGTVSDHLRLDRALRRLTAPSRPCGRASHLA